MALHYRDAIAMVHCLQMCHAAELYASTKAATAWTTSNLGSNIFRFLPSALPLAPSTNNDDDQYIITVQSDGKYRYEDTSNWAGIEFRSQKRGVVPKYIWLILWWHNKRQTIFFLISKLHYYYLKFKLFL